MQIIRVRLINSDGISKGCEKAPVEILKQLRFIEYSEKDKKIEFDKLNLEEIHVNLENIEEANWLIYENCKEIFEKHSKAFFIGGDHSISYSILRSFNKVQEKPFLVVFDAHVDCKIPGKEAKNRDWLRKLIETGYDPDNLVVISSRSILEEEMSFLKENKITVIKMELLQEDLEGVCDLIMERARNSTGFYLSVDLNCVDPAFAPGVSEIEPGGMSSRDLIYFVKRLMLLDNFCGADIVEINPDKDFRGMTVRLGAKILSEMI
jgi:agmatinase